MHPFVRRALVALGASAVLAAPAVAALAQPAGAATVAHSSLVGDPPSPEQAGYAVTGGQFRYISGEVYLRNPASYASEVAGFGQSVQLWSASKVIVLGVSDGTVASPYSPAVAVYDTSSHALVCSTAASGPQECAGTPASWVSGAANVAIGHYVTLSAYYNQGTGNVTLTVHDITAGTSTAATFDAGTGAKFTQARVGTEFGVSPWSAVNYTAPKSAAKIASFSGGVVTNYKGKRYALGASVKGYPAFGPVVMTSDGTLATPAEVTPTVVSGGGFTNTLQP